MQNNAQLATGVSRGDEDDDDDDDTIYKQWTQSKTVNTNKSTHELPKFPV